MLDGLNNTIQRVHVNRTSNQKRKRKLTMQSQNLHNSLAEAALRLLRDALHEHHHLGGLDKLVELCTRRLVLKAR